MSIGQSAVSLNWSVCDPGRNRISIEPPVNPQRTPEGFASYGFVDTVRRGMHPRSPTLQCRGRVRDHCVTTRNNPQKRGCVRSCAAAEAGSNVIHLSAAAPAALANRARPFRKPSLNLQLSSESLRVVRFIRRSLMSSQRQRVKPKPSKKGSGSGRRKPEADRAFHSLSAG